MKCHAYIKSVPLCPGAVGCPVLPGVLLYLLCHPQSRTHRSKPLAAILLSNSMMMFCDSFAWIFQSNPSTLGYYVVRISNYLVFCSTYLTISFVIVYVKALLAANGRQLHRRWVASIHLICGLGLVLMTISQFNHMFYYFDEGNTYHRAGYYWICIIIGYVPLIIMSILLIIRRKDIARAETASLFVYLLLPQAAAIIQIFVYFVSFTNIAATISVLLLFLTYELGKAKRMTQQELELAQKDAELSQKQIQIMLTQIQPHFLYNSLATISYLCTQNATLARQAVDSFAHYLRMNLDTLKENYMIPFSKELEHIKTYLWLEQLRFGDDLQVEYDVQVTKFYLPSLCVQPLVENAVKHGLCRTESGGTIWISTREINGGIEIVVKDNGAGFDMNEPPQDGRTHVGVENVSLRLKNQCGGTLTLESAPSQGTTATIFLPTSEK